MRMKLLFILISCSFFSLLAGCERSNHEESSQQPAKVVKVPGSKFNHVILSQDAANKIGIQLVPVKEYAVQSNVGASNVAVPSVQQTNVIMQSPPQTMMAKQIPYSAIIYGQHGETWIYMLVKPLTFVRTPVVVKHISGDMAELSAGPPLNTQIVSVGAMELYGAEYLGNIEP